ncbi:hypothetical protein CTI12_AA168660 [Artemisia annua]|uniref:Uncharacterized protein n=1 Tax=Artemisia annua TaxID=35608 RepID=A0A2U1PCH2_ARTAN|nr:hypothetical protein CTI12_AA168660 [Artemisia annua]
MAASSSNQSQKRHVGRKETEMEEIVRYMSNLPAYLERGKPIQDRALNFGVMDWGRLEQWQYYHHKKGVTGSDKSSPSTSNSSSLFSSGGSVRHSSKVQGSSSAPLKPHHSTLQSHLNISPEEISSKDRPVNHSTEKKTTNRSRTTSRRFKDVNPQKNSDSKSSDDLESFRSASSSSLKGKSKIQDELVNGTESFQDSSYGTSDDTLFQRHKSLVIFPDDIQKDSKHDVVNRKDSHNEASSEINSSTPCKTKATEAKELSLSSKKSDFKDGRKHRYSFSMSSKSATKTVESPPVSHNSTKDSSSVTKRSHTSPLKRLLDPLFSSKSKSNNAETPPENAKVKAKVKMDLRNCKEVKVDNSCRNKMNDSSSKIHQAMFQVAVKNGRPLFTFAVDNNNDILAATVRSMTGKDDTNSWIYTFFSVQEVKKKKGGWLSQGTKGINPGYLPNVTAQMKVSNPSPSNCTTREFVLSSMDSGSTDDQILDAHLEIELAAIVVQFLGKAEKDESQDYFSTTVILPGGHHSVPRKGEPSPLIERWRSGGVCDCGGWDVGCRLRTLTNKVESERRSNSPESFNLFFQGDEMNGRPFFSLSPLKEGIFSVEYSTPLSLLHAFSICISVIECRKSSDHTYVAKQVDEGEVDEDEAPVAYTSLPPISPVGRV